MNTAISIENLSKIYRIGEYGTGTLSHDLHRWIAKVRKKEDPYLTIGVTNDRDLIQGDVVYSLRDINLEIKEGDAVGIIGNNGAGKSTLLKILSRVTYPTSGKIRLKGRVASLLEVGTGFHPELTGLENIYLNGAIMGMRKREISNRLDEIIDFSGIGKYINTPVKRYSTGMYIRLAFAVAAHLESEILIVDEVLAVGDMDFQKKCLGKMGDISKGQGRTVLFVSHNMAAIKSLCKKGVHLQNGLVKNFGSVADIVHSYISNAVKAGEDGTIPSGASTYYTGVARYSRLSLANQNATQNSIYYKSPIRFSAQIECNEDVRDVVLDLIISNKDGVQAVHCSNRYSKNTDPGTYNLRKGTNNIEVEIENFLQPGLYTVSPGIHLETGLSLDFVENVLDLEVLKIAEGNEDGYLFNWDSGIVRLNSDWKVYD